MNTFWQKFVAGVRFTLLGILIVHVILFLIFNSSDVVDTRLSLVWKSYDRPNFLIVMMLTSIISIFGWWLIRTSYKTIRMMSASGTRSRVAKLERDQANLQAKAAMLQTKPVATSEGVTVQVDKLGKD